MKKNEQTKEKNTNKKIKKSPLKQGQTKKASVDQKKIAKVKDKQIKQEQTEEKKGAAIKENKTVDQKEKPAFIDFLKNTFKSIFEAYLSGFRNCFNVKGRASRLEYWSFFLINLFVGSICQISGLYIVKTIYFLIVLIPSVTLTIRRMHDLNKSVWKLLGLIGLMLLLLIIFTVCGHIYTYATGMLDVNPIWITYPSALLSYLIVLCVFLYWMCRRGDQAENKYGPAPLNQEKRYVLPFIALLIVALFSLNVGFNRYMIQKESNKFQKEVEQIALLGNHIRYLFQDAESYEGLSRELLLQYNAVPETMIGSDHRSIVGIYGSELDVRPFEDHFLITYENVPDQICGVMVRTFRMVRGVVDALCMECENNKCTFILETH